MIVDMEANTQLSAIFTELLLRDISLFIYHIFISKRLKL